MHLITSIPSSATASQQPDLSLKILLVEDNQIACKTAKSLLEEMNHTVDVAENSAVAIDLFIPGKYDLIFTDIGLPDLDGYSLTEHLRKLEADTNAQRTPMVALTAHDSTNISHKAQASGINDILSKPLSVHKIIQVINQFIYPNKGQIKQSFSNRPLKMCIDLDDGAKILGKDQAAAKKMLDDFIPSLAEHRAMIEKAYRTNDLKALGDSIHHFCGGLCYVGAPYLRRAAKDLRAILLKKEEYQVNHFYQRLLDEMSALEKEYWAGN